MVISVCNNDIDLEYLVKYHKGNPMIGFAQFVVNLFKYLDNKVYQRACEDFRSITTIGLNTDNLDNLNICESVNIQGCKHEELKSIIVHDFFREWFTFDYNLNKYGESPFDVSIQYYCRIIEKSDYGQFNKFREIADTNFVSLYRIIQLDSSEMSLYVKDLFTMNTYFLCDPFLAASHIRDGVFIGRIARVCGMWQTVGIPLHVSKQSDIRKIVDLVRQISLKPLYIDYICVLNKLGNFLW